MKAKRVITHFKISYIIVPGVDFKSFKFNKTAIADHTNSLSSKKECATSTNLRHFSTRIARFYHEGVTVDKNNLKNNYKNYDLLKVFTNDRKLKNESKHSLLALLWERVFVYGYSKYFFKIITICIYAFDKNKVQNKILIYIFSLFFPYFVF